MAWTFYAGCTMSDDKETPTGDDMQKQLQDMLKQANMMFQSQPESTPEPESSEGDEELERNEVLEQIRESLERFSENPEEREPMKVVQEKLEQLALGGLLLDVGNIRLPKELLEKRETLSNEEWDTIKTHVIHSIALIQRSKEVSSHVIDMVSTHHERYDGSGYPKGLEGDEIPLLGQIAGIVDAYVSVTFPRPGRNAVPSDFATNVLFKQRNKYFKADLVDKFIACVGLYPPGSLVELNTGQVAIVVTQNTQWRLRPRIMLILDKNKTPLDSYPFIDLMTEIEDEAGNPLSIKNGIRDGEYSIDISKLTF
jgi:response regulator RpfG family c-di-GMP phosphodiesterase